MAPLGNIFFFKGMGRMSFKTRQFLRASPGWKKNMRGKGTKSESKLTVGVPKQDPNTR